MGSRAFLTHHQSVSDSYTAVFATPPPPNPSPSAPVCRTQRLLPPTAILDLGWVLWLWLRISSPQLATPGYGCNHRDLVNDNGHSVWLTLLIAPAEGVTQGEASHWLIFSGWSGRARGGQ
ncbi:hypothetical protein J4Q44_G00056810 [Coregonus suidteri]|uniref:Uncharacterized protein n=1 Tax=Coregonus suidteri TaxID=861788 RepID=A0AAN8MAJ1_9TELE